MAHLAKKDATAVYEQASPALLAKQPGDPRDSSKKEEGKDWQKLRSHLENRLTGLRNWRSSWWATNWANLAAFILPRRSIWLTQSAGGMPTPNNMVRGLEINNAIVDPTATFAVRVCASGLMTGLASPSREWFKVQPKSKNVELDADAKQWIDDVEERIYTVLAGSNFYNAFAQECEDLVVFGTGVSIIYEDEEDLIRCYNPCVGEYYLASGATMRIDGLYRQFVMTTAQMVDFFGIDNCPPQVRSMWGQKGNRLDQERLIAHSIEPNFEIAGGVGKIPGNFAWREVYWVYGSGAPYPLSMRGFVDKPFTAARWATQSNDAYGRSPGMDILPDVLQLQMETRKKAEAIQKQVNPPLLADMQMKNEPSSSVPGSVTYVANLGTTTGMKPIYEVNPDIKAMMEDIAAIQQRIKVGLFNDLFLMLEQGVGNMTATEVTAKINEKMQVLGPVIENLISESLKPKLKRIYAIMQSRGFIDPVPDSLKGVALDIEFVSIFALAQRAAATGGLERIAALIGNLSPVFAEAKLKLNVPEFIDEMNDMLGNPEKILHDNKYVTQIMTQQAQDAKRQQDMAEAQHVAQTAGVAANAGQVLSQTAIGGGQTALNQLLGTGGGGQ